LEVNILYIKENEMAKNWLRMLVITLVFGVMVIGCDDVSTNGNGGGADPALNGTWILTSGNIQYELRNNNGSWEQSVTATGIWNGYSGLMGRGAYIASGGNYNSTVTHYYGNFVNAAYQGSQVGSGWITMEQYYSAMERFYRQTYTTWTEEQINTQMNSLRNPQQYTWTYSIQGNTPVFTGINTSNGLTTTSTYTSSM
jgi:hypothetical protein